MFERHGFVKVLCRVFSRNGIPTWRFFGSGTLATDRVSSRVRGLRKPPAARWVGNALLYLAPRYVRGWINATQDPLIRPISNGRSVSDDVWDAPRFFPSSSMKPAPATGHDGSLGRATGSRERGQEGRLCPAKRQEECRRPRDACRRRRGWTTRRAPAGTGPRVHRGSGKAHS